MSQLKKPSKEGWPQLLQIGLLGLASLGLAAYLLVSYVQDQATSIQLQKLEALEGRLKAPAADHRTVWDSWRQFAAGHERYHDGNVKLEYEHIEPVFQFMSGLQRQGWKLVQYRTDNQVADRLYEDDSHTACVSTHTERDPAADGLHQSIVIYDGRSKVCRTGHNHPY